MYLIYVSARPPTESQRNAPQQDLQPIMLAINCDKTEYFLRESESKHISVDKPKNYQDIERIFVNLRCADDDAEQDDDEDDDSEPSTQDLEKSIETGEAHLAIALATIFFGKGKIEPRNQDFVEHVRDRSRIADCLVVAGYTDSKCSMQKSEAIAMDRAQAIRKILREHGLDMPIVVVARPSCAYGTIERYSRRVEVTALFRSGDSGGGGGNDGDSPDTPPPGPGKAKAKPKKNIKAVGKDQKKKKQKEKVVHDELVTACEMSAEAGQGPCAMFMPANWLPKKPLAFLAALALLAICLMPTEAWALNTDDDFAEVVTELTEWIQGGLGITISLSAVIVGALLSIVRSNPLPILSGIAFAMILNFTPTVITGIISGLI